MKSGAAKIIEKKQETNNDSDPYKVTEESLMTEATEWSRVSIVGFTATAEDMIIAANVLKKVKV